MSQSGAVSKRLAEVAGVAGGRHTIVRARLERLRAHGLVPAGRHGRGLEHGQYEAPHLANVLLSFAPGPLDAADTVLMLRNLVYRPTPAAPTPYVEGARTLGEAVELMIQGAAMPAESGPGKVLPAIDLRLWPVEAVMRWEELERSDLYRPQVGHASRVGGGVTTTFTLHPIMLLVASELWLDTMEYQHRRDLKAPGQNETAAPSPKGTAASGAGSQKPALSPPAKEKRHAKGYTTSAGCE